MADLGIINSALIKISESPLSANDGSRRAVFAFSQYDRLRQALLRGYNWNFAMRRAVLATSPTAPLFGFRKRAELPNDLLHLRGVYSSGEPQQNYTTADIPHRVEGGFLLVDSDAPQIFYTADLMDSGAFDPLFSEALAWRLALDLSFALSTGPNMAQVAERGFAFALREAKVANSIEGTPELIQASEWVDSHFGRVRGRGHLFGSL